ncbi:hypothetical protein ACFW04_014777 [Cataglyphis niger]
MYIINAIVKLGYFPQEWKKAIVISILKPRKDSTKPSNYRPISLLSSISKVVKKVMLNKIRKYEAQNNITIDEQFWFREKHNTVQQVVRIVNDIRYNFNKGNVWMDGLLYQMIQYNYPIAIIRLIQSYLYDRKLQVRINNTNSKEKAIKAGVPQGSVLGPILFSIYVNDVVRFAKTKLAMFADDTAIYAHSFSAIVAAKQIHINLLQEYYTKWKITLNAAKMEMIVFTRKIKDSTVKYLGVNLDYKLTYKIHIKTTLNKIYAVMKQLYPLMIKDSAISRCNKILIYKMILSYQNKCLRLILNAGRYSRIIELHEQTQIPYIKKYVYNIAERFYNTQLEHNKLTKDITQLRVNNIYQNILNMKYPIKN